MNVQTEYKDLYVRREYEFCIRSVNRLKNNKKLFRTVNLLKE